MGIARAAPTSRRSGHTPILAWYWLALAFYLAEVLVVHLQFRKQAHTLSLTEIGLTLGLLLAAPSTLLIGQLVGTFVALVVNRRRSQLRQLAKFAFNLAELPLCSGIALLVFRSLASPADSAPHLWVLVLLACAVAHVVGILLVSAVIAIAEERLQAPQLGRTLVTSTLGALATASLGLAIVELLGIRPAAVLLLVVPVLATVAAFRGYMEQREQREHVEFLYESMRATQGAPEFGLAVGQLLVAARRLLRAEYAEILLLPASDDRGPLRSVSGAGGELLMHPEESFSSADALAFKEIASIGSATLLARRRATHAFDAFLRSRGLEDAIVAPLRGEDRTFGLLVVGERLGDVSTFAEADVELLVTFAGHASILLENGRLEHSLAEVTELKEQLAHQAYHDALTGLPNRVNLLEAVEKELERGKRLAAVLYLDLYRFKTVNDTWGHPPATSCSPSSRAPWPAPSASRISPRGSAATSSPFSSATRPLRPQSAWRGACWTRSTARTASVAATSPATSASASPSGQQTPRAARTSSAMRTSRCTASSGRSVPTRCTRRSCTRSFVSSGSSVSTSRRQSSVARSSSTSSRSCGWGTGRSRASRSWPAGRTRSVVSSLPRSSCRPRRRPD